jgi:outer membrane protein W
MRSLRKGEWVKSAHSGGSQHLESLMSRGKSFCAAMVLLALAIPAFAQSNEHGTWELTLAAIGQSNKDFDQHAVGVNVGIGYFLINNLELSLRQTVVYVKDEDGSAANASTSFALDYHFPLGDRGQWQPFIGANGGYFYGDTFNDTFEYAPEAGLKYFVNSSTFLYFRVEYNIFAKDFTGNSDSEDRQFTYGVGIGLRF